MPPSRRFFRRLDRDRSLSLDAGELQRGLAELGLALGTAEAEGVCRRWDRDGSGALDLEEFLRALRVGPLPVGALHPAAWGAARGGPCTPLRGVLPVGVLPVGGAPSPRCVAVLPVGGPLHPAAWRCCPWGSPFTPLRGGAGLSWADVAAQTLDPYH